MNTYLVSGVFCKGGLLSKKFLPDLRKRIQIMVRSIQRVLLCQDTLKLFVLQALNTGITVVEWRRQRRRGCLVGEQQLTYDNVLPDIANFSTTWLVVPSFFSKAARRKNLHASHYIHTFPKNTTISYYCTLFENCSKWLILIFQFLAFPNNFCPI